VVGPVFVTETSALAERVVVAVEVSFPLFVSIVDVVTFAVFDTDTVALPDVLTTSVKVAVAPLASEAHVQVTVPFAPADGVLQMDEGPLSGVSETNVFPAARTSLSCVFAASPGPWFVTVIEYEMLLPATAETGPVFVTSTSVMPLTVAELDAVSFPLLGSKLSLLAAIELVMVLPSGVLGLTLSTSV
jgi:hypothetical protein